MTLYTEDEGTKPVDHSQCRPREHCGAQDCPGYLAWRTRTAALQGRWSTISPPRESGYRFVEERPVTCGSTLELQAIEQRDDDYGSYLAYLQHGTRVRFELAGGTPVFYANVAGHDFTAKLEPAMRFRWPRSC